MTINIQKPITQISSNIEVIAKNIEVVISRGQKGEPGNAATISVGTVTTGEPGSSVAVTNVGTANAAILNFSIPSGAQGVQGIQGLKGDKGDTPTTFDWANITGKPATFAPSSHTHVSASISDASSAPVLVDPEGEEEIYKELAVKYGADGKIEVIGLKQTSLTVGLELSGEGFTTVSSNPYSILRWSKESINSSFSFGTNAFAASTDNNVNISIPLASGYLAITDNTNGAPDKLTDGTITGTLAINSNTITYGAGAAAAHRNALGIYSTTGTYTAGQTIYTSTDQLRLGQSDTSYVQFRVINGQLSLLHQGANASLSINSPVYGSAGLYAVNSTVTNYLGVGSVGSINKIFTTSSSANKEIHMRPNDGASVAIFSITGVSIGASNPDTKAALDIQSTTQGFLPPRMTTVQRNAISSVPAGLTLYDTTANKTVVYNGTAWEILSANTSGIPDLSSIDLQTKVFSNSLMPYPVLSFFDDCDGRYDYTVTQSGSGGSFGDADNTGNLAYGVYRIITGSVSTNFFRAFVRIGGGVKAIGTTFQTIFAIDNILDCEFFTGFTWVGIGQFGLAYRSGLDGGLFTFRHGGSNYATLPGSTATPQNGTFMSGKRYKFTMTQLTNTTSDVVIEEANFDSASWSTLYSGVVTHSSRLSAGLGMCPSIEVLTKTNAQRAVYVDYFRFENSSFSR